MFRVSKAISIASFKAIKIFKTHNSIANRVIVGRKFSSTQPGSQVAKGLVFDTVVELQINACKEYSSKPLFGTRVGETFEWMNYTDFNKQVELFRKVLVHHHIGKNDKVALISNNRVEWAVAMYAVAGVGGQLVPMYEAQLEKDWLHIINDSGAKMLLVGPEKIYEKTKNYVGQVGNIASVLCLDASPDFMHSYKRWMSLAVSQPFVPAIAAVKEDVLVLIYTSGTTGNPKGVELSHENVVHVLRGLQKLWDHEARDHRTMAFLPWAHVFGQSTELHPMMSTGSSMGIVANREQILESIVMLKPTVVLSVPVLLNRIFDGVMKKMATESPLKQKLFATAMQISRRRNDLLERGLTVGFLLDLQFQLADKIVFSKLRQRFGGNIKYFASGGASVSLPVLQFFEDIGMPICEGYGLTETSPVVTSSSNRWTHRRLGCVGVAIDGVDLRILDPETLAEMPLGSDGEICVSGPSVMVGYHNNAKANDEVFFYKDGKRFFKSGDMGRMVDGRFLKITGRIKEQFKLENGKYVVPAPLEDHITRSGFIAQAFLYGDNRPYTVTLIVPDFVELRSWAVKHLGSRCPPVGDDAALLLLQEVKALLSDEVISACSVMKNYERPHKWFATAELFSQENQMMTPKMSLRRNNVLKVFMPQIEAVYANTDGVSLVRTVSTVEDN